MGPIHHHDERRELFPVPTAGPNPVCAELTVPDSATLGAGSITYGLTPPKRGWTPERIASAAKAQTDRLKALPIDAVVVYDVQDESTRTTAKRPFPYVHCVDPLTYAFQHLAEVELPKVVYRSVSQDTPATLDRWLSAIRQENGAAVLVGAPSSDQPVRMTLHEAYQQRRRRHAVLPTGGVMIAERHRSSGREHERTLDKGDQGCSFFISQAVFSAEATKDVLSDLKRACDHLGKPVPPVIITLAPCGSPKTLEFIKWLGVYVPRWFENELRTSTDTLATSVRLGIEVFSDLHEFATDRGIPLGCNIESVSIRRDEIDASVHLTQHVAKALRGR